MAKLDPIVSEFESEEAAEAYDTWFRAQVEKALAETGPGIPHEEVMAGVQAIIEKHAKKLTNARPDLAA
jgi:predicted esterase